MDKETALDIADNVLARLIDSFDSGLEDVPIADLLVDYTEEEITAARDKIYDMWRMERDG